jgi:predicted short-subunit dehydrogenase-like oxidoreductase (DUF2520 family)
MMPRLGVIGAGRVGTALARLLSGHGWPVAAVYSRTPAHASTLAGQVGAQAVTSPGAVIAAADLTLLTVPDDQIADLAATLARDAQPGRAVVHTSGAHGAEALAAVAAQGMRAGSLHPAFPFAGGDLPNLTGVCVAVEAEDGELRGLLLALVESLGAVSLVIPAGGKAQYHAALAIASNYAVTLYAEAERLLLALGLPRESAGRALDGLLKGTVDNLSRRGIPDALTGPLSRADEGTLRLHLTALDAADPDLAALYRHLARRTLPLVRARGVRTDALETLLTEESAHAPDRS